VRLWITIVLRIALVWAIAACANPVEELYDALEIPPLPSTPDQDRVKSCQACAEDKCGAQRTACMEDDACRALLGCKGWCTEPTCLQRCTADHGFSPWYDDFWACVLTDECAKPCMSGENFACVGKYEAPKADQGTDKFPVTFHFKNPRTRLANGYTGDQRDEQFVVGASAQSCQRQKSAMSSCISIASDTVDRSNAVKLNLSVQPDARYFAGTIEVDLKDWSQAAPERTRQLAWHDRYMPPPFAEKTEFRFYVYARDLFPEARDAQGAAVISAADAAPLAIYLEDCMGVPARGVRIELVGQPDIDVKNQVCGVDTFGAETNCGSAMVGNISDPLRHEQISVQAVHVATKTVVAKRSDIYVREGWATHVWLMPQSSR
jgi:hypothetical protein